MPTERTIPQNLEQAVNEARDALTKADAKGDDKAIDKAKHNYGEAMAAYHAALTPAEDLTRGVG